VCTLDFAAAVARVGKLALMASVLAPSVELRVTRSSKLEVACSVAPVDLLILVFAIGGHESKLVGVDCSFTVSRKALLSQHCQTWLNVSPQVRTH